MRTKVPEKLLKILAEQRGMSVNRLMEEMATLMLAEFDAETRFQLRAVRGAGKTAKGLELLDKAVDADGK